MNLRELTEKNRELTQDKFETLLARLHPDREVAGQKYNLLHKKLERYFSLRESSAPSSELADEVLNRLAKLLKEGKYLDDKLNLNYAIGIAKFVYREYRKKPSRVSLDEIPPSEDDQHPSAEEILLVEEEHQRIRDALKLLPEKDVEFIVNYEANQEMRTSEINRQRARRIRARLRQILTGNNLEEKMAYQQAIKDALNMLTEKEREFITEYELDGIIRDQANRQRARRIRVKLQTILSEMNLA